MKVQDAGDDPDHAEQETDGRGSPDCYQKRSLEAWSPAYQWPLIVPATQRHFGRSYPLNLSGNTLSPPRPEKIEFVSEGTSKMPTVNTPIITSACRAYSMY
jgi:hypothetical protein